MVSVEQWLGVRLMVSVEQWLGVRLMVSVEQWLGVCLMVSVDQWLGVLLMLSNESLSLLSIRCHLATAPQHIPTQNDLLPQRIVCKYQLNCEYCNIT